MDKKGIKVFYLQKYNKLTFLADQLRLHNRLVVLDTIQVFRPMEQNKERQPLLGQLLGILERDLAHERHALLLRPDVQLVHVLQVAGERLIVFVRQINVRPEHDNRLTRRMHLRHRIAEAHMELAVVLQVGGDAPEYLVLGLMTAIEVADHDALLGVKLLQILQIVELNDRIDQLFFYKINERFGRSFASILAFARLSIADDLQRWVFTNLEAGRDRRLSVAVHFTHDDAAGFGKRLADLNNTEAEKQLDFSLFAKKTQVL